MGKRFTSTVAGASVFISVILILSKGLGFFREISFAFYFGISDQFDLYLVSSVLPLTISIVLLYIGQNFFIPAYYKILSENRGESSNFLFQSIIIFTISAVGISILLYFFSSNIISYYLFVDDPLKISISLKIFRLFLVVIPISAITSILSAYLQAKLEFRYPAISFLFLNVSILIVIIVFAADIGVFTIVYGYIIGNVLQLLFLGYRIFKLNEIRLKDFQLKINFLSTTFTSSIFLIIVIESIGQLYMIVDRFFYNTVDAGGIASLSYAQSLYHFPISIFSLALGTAIFPLLSSTYHKGLKDELNFLISESYKVSIAIFIPITIIYIYYGHTIIKLVYEYGRFTSLGTQMTFEVIQLLALSLVFYSVYTILNKLFYSAGLIKQLLLITIFCISIKIIANFYLSEKLGQNGLALSTSISYFLFFFISMIYLHRKLNIRNTFIFICELIFMFLNGSISYLISTLFVQLFGGVVNFAEIIGIVFFVLTFYFNLSIIQHSFINHIYKIVTDNVFVRTKK